MAIGDIGASLIDFLSPDPCLDVSSNVTSSIAHARDNWFVVVYGDPANNQIKLASFECDTSGVIPAAVQDTVILAATTGALSPDIIEVASGVVAIIWTDPTNGPTVQTYTIDACGNFGACDPVDTLDLNTSVTDDTTVLGIFKTEHTDMFAALWGEDTRDLDLGTFTIDTDGNISDTLLAHFSDVHTDIGGGSRAFTYTGVGDIYAVAFKNNNDNKGFIETYTIDACGNISCPLDSDQPTNMQGGQAMNTDGTRIVAVYVATGLDAQTFDVDACGIISRNGKFDLGTAATQEIIRLDEVNKDVFLVIMASSLRSIIVDACGIVTQQDSLLSEPKLNTEGSITLHPGTDGTSGIVVGSSFQTGGSAEFFVWSVSVEIDIPAVEDIELGIGAGKIGAGIRVDWDNNGTFDADEELGPDVTSLRWTMGKDPEELNTPGGTLIIEVEDPKGDYVPGESATAFDSKFTSSDVSVGKDVTANLEYDGTSHAIFRGSIVSITPFRFNGEQRATLFCVDEMDRFSEIKLSVPLSSTIGAVGSSGDVTSSGMRPMGSQDGESVKLGETTGLIAHILNDASFSSARALSEKGRSTMDNYWIYNTTVRDAFFDIEKHERGSIFMSSSGDVTFLSSTHYTGLASSATFGPSTSLFTRMDYSMNSRDITNRVLATVHDRSTAAALGVVGFLEPNTISISQGSEVEFEVIFDKAPCRSITIPSVEKDSTFGISAVGAGGTSHVSNTTSGNHVAIFGQVRGASSILLNITNNAGETVTLQQPETAEDSGVVPISGIVMPNLIKETTAVSIASRDIYGRRNFNVDYPFFEGVSKGNDVAQNIVNNGSTAVPTGIRLHMVGSDSNLVLQILSRAIGDVIAVNSTHFHLATNQNFYITGLEGEIAAGGPLQTVWTLQKST